MFIIRLFWRKKYELEKSYDTIVIFEIKKNCLNLGYYQKSNLKTQNKEELFRLFKIK